MRTFELLFATSSLLVTSVAAQSPTVVAGERVRLSQDCTVVPTSTGGLRTVCLWHQGTFVRWSVSEAILQKAGRDDPLAIPMASIVEFQVQRGRQSHPVKGAGRGLLIGGIAGLAIGVALYLPGGDNQCRNNFVNCPLAGVAIGGGFGTLVGLITGAIPRDQWVDVSLGQSTTAPFGPRFTSHGFELSFRI